MLPGGTFVDETPHVVSYNPWAEDQGFALSAEKPFYHFDDTLDLGFSQLRVNRQAETFAGGLLGNWEVAFFVSQMRVTLLQVQRKRIMQCAADLVSFEML